jgi:hypothetical protein
MLSLRMKAALPTIASVIAPARSGGSPLGAITSRSVPGGGG